jgi:hypothetical protein
MSKHEASRTLVKSPPELWAELSDQASLAGHLAEPFGEIRITRLEPETDIAWEGERASGTVRIEPSGWGTRVTLTARAVEAGPHELEQEPERPAPQPAPLPRPAPAPEELPPAAAAPEPPEGQEPGPSEPPEAPRLGFGARLRGWLWRKPALEVAPAVGAAAEAEPAVVSRETGERVPGPERVPEPEPEPELAAPPPAATSPNPSAIDADAVLVGVLDKLGAAHHRPFSRA